MANEKRLINANRALEVVREHRHKYPNAYHLTNYATLILREAPTVDAVEVVRCKDCKRFVDNREAFVTYCKRELKDLYVKPNDFCSYGERREGE